MKNLKQLITTTLLATLCIAAQAQQIKVACVGNSITYGARIENRETMSYPAQLQQLLGDKYQVQNFGVSGATTLAKGNKPYINTPAYAQSLEFEPNIVLIKLGTNDSKPDNMKHFDEYEGDYQRIIDSYLSLASNPRIILITPLKCYLDEDKPISDERLQLFVTPAIQQLATKNNLEVVYGYPLCGTQLDLDIMPDRLHPSAAGAEMMAQHLYKVVLKTK